IAPASFTLNGNGATIDASGLEGAMITTPAGDLEEWMIGDFLVKDVTVKGLAKAFYASAGKNYYYNSFKIENSVVELTANITYFDFTKGGVANMTINNSTLYGAVDHTKTLYSSQSAQRPTDYKSDATQTFAITNSTLYNLAKGANFFTHRQNSQKWLTYVLKNSVFVNVGKSGQVAQGLNGGGQSTNPTWDIDGNVYNFDGADTSAKENPANDGGESVKNSIAGVITFTDAEAGDFTGNLELPFGVEAPATQPGDPRWTLTYSNAPETFAITVAETENGTVTVDKTEAAEGETVTITATPSEGYEIDEIKVVAADETEVTVTDNTFEMPAQAVTVTVTFKTADGIENINAADADNGAWYNLNGMRVEKPVKGGIYIHNGKKIVIK
ncbi:MAG: DUF4957 domain-containing protein, partial [Prevotella sp.]|nr:DUF4957 domain-containing protein [Prevotella sp.]